MHFKHAVRRSISRIIRIAVIIVMLGTLVVLTEAPQPAAAATAPTAPLNLRVTATGNGTASLDWDAPTTNGGLNISAYVVRVSPNCALCTGTVALLDSQTTIGGLTNGVNYSFSVAAVNLIGTGVDSVSVGNVTIGIPDAVTLLTAPATGDKRVDLAWLPPLNLGLSPITGYEVSVNPPCAACTGLSPTTSSTSVVGLDNGVQYTFSVKARNAAGVSMNAAVIVATPSTVPEPPLNVTVTSTGDGYFALSWNPPANDNGLPVINYLVDVTPSCFLCLGVLSLNTTTIITGVDNGTAYTARVRAVNLKGPSAPSAPAVATPSSTPGLATGLTTTGSTGNGSVSLSWSAPSSNGGSAVTGYDIDVSPACAGCTGTSTTGTSTTVSGLTNGTNYTFRVRAKNSQGPGLYGGITTATPATTPGAPTALVKGSTGNQQVNLSWTAPASNGGAPITGYTVTPSPACGGCTGLTTSRPGTSTTVGGLTNGTSYTFSVVANNSKGSSPASNSVTAAPSTTAAAPTGLTVGATGDAQVSLTWTPPASSGGSPITGYLIQTNPVCIGCFGTIAIGSSGTVSGLTNGVSYDFSVLAINANGQGSLSTTVSATASTVAGAATGVQATDIGNGRVDLSWTAPTDTGGNAITGYQVDVLPSCGGCTGLTISGTTTSTSVTGLTNGTSYSLRVRTITTAGTGPASVAVMATPRTNPGAPTGLTTTGSGNGEARLSWSAPASNGGSAITGYTVNVSPACSGCTGLTSTGTSTTIGGLTNGVGYTFTVVANNDAGTSGASGTTTATPSTVATAPDSPSVAATGNGTVDLSWLPPSSNGGSAVTGYTVLVSPACGGCTGTSVSGNSTTISGLTNGTTYSFTVVADNSRGTSPASSAVTGTPATAPNAPTALTVASTGDAGAVLSWTPPAATGGSPVTGYVVNVSPACSDCTGLTPSSPSTSISGLTNGTPYTFSVVAVNAKGSSSASTTAGGTPSTSPDAPTAVTVASTGNASADLTWTAPSDNGGSAVTNYNVQVTPTCGSCTGTNTSGTSTTVNGLTNGVEYTFSLTATNARGQSAASDTDSGTPSTVPDAPTSPSAPASTDGRVDLGWTAPASNGGSPLTGYEVLLSPACASCTGKTPTGTTTSIVGLTNGTPYTFTIRAINANGPGATSTGVTATPVLSPGEPVNVDATPGDGMVELDWDAPPSGSPAVSYDVLITPTCSACVISYPTTTSARVAGLSNGTRYSFAIVSVNSQGNGPATAPVTETPSTVSASPTSIRTTGVDTGQVDLAWNAPTTDGGAPITGYEVQVSPACASCTGLNPVGPSTAIVGLTNGVPYTFTVKALNASGLSATSASWVTATPTPRTTTPNNVVVTMNSPTAVGLSWQAPNDTGGRTITRYDISVSPACAECTGTSTTGTTATVSGLNPNTTYTYRVMAVYNDATVVPSDTTITDTTAQVAAAPTTTTTTPSTPSGSGSGSGSSTGPKGYWLVASDGGIFAYRDSKFFGSTGSIKLNKPIVGMAHTPSDQGYWLVASDGGIFAYGDAKFYGSTGAIKLNQPIVAMTPTPSGLGYWLVASDGGIFAYGDAKFYGSTGGSKINKPIIGVMSTPSGLGYWLIASDGGIFAYGDAKFYGSPGGSKLNQPIVGGSRTPSGLGYWLVASDGGIFAYGDAKFYGSTGGSKINQPIVGMESTDSGLGYWLVASDGGIFAYGDAAFYGSTGGSKINKPVVGMSGL